MLTSQRFGAGDERALRVSVKAHYWVAALLAAGMTALFVLCAEPLLRLLNTTPDTIAYARTYLTIIYAGIPATMLYNLLAALLRAVGDSKTPLVFLALSSAVNIALDYLFIMAFGWDVAGAAWATVAAQLLSAVLCLLYIRRKAPMLLPGRERPAVLRPAMRQELKVGLPLGVQHAFIALGSMAVQYFLNGLGSAAVAAYTIGNRVQNLMQNPLVSMNAVLATYVGQNVGANRPDRIRAGIRQSLIFSGLLGLVVSGLVWAFAEPITLLFVGPEETAVIALVRQYLAWVCPFLWALGFLFVCRGAIEGLGDGVTPLVSSVLELVMRVAISVLFCASYGFAAVCAAGTAAWFSCAVLIAAVCAARVRKWDDLARAASESAS